MKWQLVATLIEDPGFTNRVSHVHLSMGSAPRLRCSCNRTLPVAYVTGEIEPPEPILACRHIRGLYDHGRTVTSVITNFTTFGREEFSWRWAVTKLAESAR